MPPSHPLTHTLIFAHIHPSLHRPTAALIVGPPWPLTGEKAQPTPSSSHMLLAAGSPAGTPRPPTFCLAALPLPPDAETSLLNILLRIMVCNYLVLIVVVMAAIPISNDNVAYLIAEICECVKRKCEEETRRTKTNFLV